ncbi:4981_t:CDS:2, partial [Diversispora eburnea]
FVDEKFTIKTLKTPKNIQNQFMFLYVFLSGTAVMITFHNFIISIVLYKARKSNVSNISKIILNLGIMLLFLFRSMLVYAPTWTELLGCQIIFYMQFVATFIYRSALAFFLLWRLRQVGNSQIDKWASIALLSTRTIAHLITFGFINVYVSRDSTRTYCLYRNSGLQIPESISIAIDFLIDIYITVRLIQILRNANKNASNLRTSMNKKTKRSLFTAVMYWNFVRLAVVFGLNIMAVVYFLPLPDTGDSHFTKYIFSTFFFILTSYVVTVDAEIVKVIEGENQNKKGSNKYTSENSSYPSSPTNRATYKNTGSEFTQEEFEEIIGSSKATNRDLEKGDATNRDSNISGGSTIIIPNTTDTTDI